MIRYLLLAMLASLVLGTDAPRWVMVCAATAAMVSVLVALARD